MIFLHSSFRTSSTWLWDRFRKLSGVTAFYEVFNEGLASIKRPDIYTKTYSGWSSKHPPGAAYFLEFAPLIEDSGGVANYDDAMAFRRFIPEDGVRGNISNEERKYLSGLVAHAEKLGTIPVLSCTRTVGRLRAIKGVLPGLHILIYRNLFRQWCSYTEQLALGNPYFFYTLKTCIDHSSHDSFLKCLKETFQLQDPKLDSSEYFCAFVLLHIYLYAQVCDAADVIFDVEKAIGDQDYRARMEHEVRSTTGLPIDLSGMKARIGFSFLNSDYDVELRDSIRVLADIAISNAQSSTARQFATKALTDFMEEWDKYNFYAGVLSTTAGPRGLIGARDSLTAEREALVVARDNAVRERDALRVERDALAKAREAFAQEHKAVVAERDALRVERDALAKAREASAQEHKAVVAERDALRVERDALATARETFAQEHNAVVAERDALRVERDVLAAERDNLRAQHDSVTLVPRLLRRFQQWR